MDNIRRSLWLPIAVALVAATLALYSTSEGAGSPSPLPPSDPGAGLPAGESEPGEKESNPGESHPGAEVPPPESPAAAADDAAWRRLQAELEAIAAEAPGTFAFAVLDLQTGRRVVVGGDQVFHPASTIKVPLVMYLYDLAAAGKIDLEERLTYLPEDHEGGTGILQSRGPGGRYTLRELADYAIRYSDNVAKNMLTRRLGWDAVTAYCAALGAGDAWNLRRTRAEDALGYLAALYARRNEPLFGLLIDLMQRTVFAPRLGAGFPPGVPVAHKIGTQSQGQFHDVALVLLPGRPFAMAGFSRGVAREEDAIAVLGRAGRAALAHFQALAAGGP
ncbi:MAG: serine hydrolase [Bacillota bacterium]|nr:MAG: hypothetical protein DIU70_07060 [Bacillota bacterium]